jgi:hypothetical protein
VSADRRLPQHAVVERRAMLHALERAFRDELQRWYAALELDFDAQRTWVDVDRAACCTWTMSRFMSPYVQVVNDALRSAAFNRCNSFSVSSLLGFQEGKSLKENWAKFWDIDVARFPMHYSPAHRASVLRVELMDRIRPSDAGELLHYTPSRNFAQTFAKGWMAGLRARAPPLIGAMLLDPLLEHVFAFLPIDALARAMFVCKAWSALIAGDRGLMERVHRAAQEEKEMYVMGYASPLSSGEWESLGGYGGSPRSYGSDW